MAKKKAFALRINEEMLKAIEKWASDEFRSTNGQIEWMLMQSLKNANRAPKKKPDDASQQTPE
ncbi:MAG: Arc family DNA-binding protein [Kordia sp.]|uniref:Arc family DNA-binding protein n=1 Tax=Kordia sp. TaxID=1965332 RepID=UPI0038597E29